MEKKLSFTFSDDDQKVLAKLKKHLHGEHGAMTNIAVIRRALRALLKESK